tara:strand:- start:220 stop:453 length:234 start_codon:yes stop_codon:yes gene_type:complete
MDVKTILKWAGYGLIALGVVDLILFYASGMETYIIPPVIVFAETDWTTYAVMIIGYAMTAYGQGMNAEDIAEDLSDE